MRTFASIVALSLSLSQSIAQTTGTFDILTFNVAGLPAILNGNGVPGDKTANTARIGQLFTHYNTSLIHVQEDFNYHATLYANDQHPYRTPTSGGVPFGSGLNTLSNFEYTGFERVKWDRCSTIEAADCFTPKGFTVMRVKISEGVWIDAYNIHADAGGSAADLSARASNLRQVSDYIKTYSSGNPVLVSGDANSRYTRTGDIPTIFSTENDMTDVWVELVRSGVPPTPGSEASVCDNPSPNTTCEIVDKVWYRGSPTVSLEAKKLQYAGHMFLQENGNVLSDHNPVLVYFAWTTSAQLRVSDRFGGEFGQSFNDLDILASLEGAKVSSVTLGGGNRVDAVSLTLSSGQTVSHGGDGGTFMTLTLNAGEALTGATLCRGEKDGKFRIFYLEITTSAGRSVQAGKKTSDCVSPIAGNGWEIVGFLGRSGDELDQVGFVYSRI